MTEYNHQPSGLGADTRAFSLEPKAEIHCLHFEHRRALVLADGKLAYGGRVFDGLNEILRHEGVSLMAYDPEFCDHSSSALKIVPQDKGGPVFLSEFIKSQNGEKPYNHPGRSSQLDWRPFTLPHGTELLYDGVLVGTVINGKIVDDFGTVFGDMRLWLDAKGISEKMAYHGVGGLSEPWLMVRLPDDIYRERQLIDVIVAQEAERHAAEPPRRRGTDPSRSRRSEPEYPMRRPVDLSTGKMSPHHPDDAEGNAAWLKVRKLDV